MTAQIFLGILAGVPATLALTLLAFLGGAALGLPLCALRMSSAAWLRFLAGFVVLGVRSIPPILWVFLVYFGMGTGFVSVSPFMAAVIGLGLITAANMSEIYRGALAAIHQGQWEAARVLSLPAWSSVLDVIGPQLMRVAIPSAAGYAIGLLKDSAVASTIGVADISFQAYHISQRTFHGLDVFAVAGFLYILISLPVAALARYADLHLRARVAR